MTPERLRARLAELYGLTVAGAQPVNGGADNAARLYRVTDAGGRAFAVKSTARGSPAGLVVPAALGGRYAPQPRRTSAGELWADVDGLRLSVVDWVDGDTALESGMDRARWNAYGRLIAALHAVPPDDTLRRWVPREDFEPGRWAALFDRVDAELDGLPRDAHGKRLAAMWLPHRDALRAVRERTIRLGAKLRQRAGLPAAVPCHADPHLGNLMVTSAGEVVLIDFDDAVLAPPERDLMFVLGGGVIAAASVTGEQQRWFAEGYGHHDPDPDLLAYYRGVRVLEDVAEPARLVLDPGSTPDERETNLGYVADVLSPRGLLGQAR
ncbi:phosphotransferase enzyme family protein [Prauserella flavalba]|uniref:Aminoglycoside phosphotransferase domain-containing protein n=1 Tax=Prauserella flavalba TaxID=1477506 RepID=A0A318LND7_9PSEU|nr:aminoglycoside phosphotransferase family protein [Prauserella flavalba]PXY36146.1 hypothetical protein BA062_11955 [Prauserella flavalba]